ncbi:bifunctional GTP diphosphokinase/guanosine-3',5'-bis(diphosphate) 3'-diphosphatase [Saccharospirillum sp. MSK14-1]|uniref:bifunctional GTP diphosphokinase/guanosine-3',5'-bis pyrophosphate 3'-pyrophosphohydrolase n=1 Tax=Saccharospirillum sp. MSK14-1 TaxID=1897632 RepID=UPI000D368CFA|nr:bifunctional GTP diphosphokinase/guanosine-3',5'-bis pyrophosphate 3'-pyrophosphohydrolase [Saccharospirillum sp. MSK14-1]PTY37647.1 bifunctional GTP diphosphokinase/guanosine-3',5'-bis(diphosphate) 3'-diphosphatase [Saccharospirillum sp. MSK14-1]
MLTVDALAKRLESYLEPDNIRRIRRAYFYAEQAHEGQMRRSGERYITHPLAVANILCEMHMDHQSLMAAMLHDVIEDTAVSKEALAEQFGPGVAELVDGVSKLTHLEFETKKEEQAENFQKMVLAMSKDIRVILVKLADRLHNMRTLGAMPPEKKRRKARETLDIYAPIALRLGINDLRIELENLAFESLYPLRAQRIATAIKKSRGNRKELVGQIRQALAERLSAEGVDVQVIGREKHLFSIYNKMKDQKKTLQEILDVYGFRIITQSVDACYRTLGVVHNFYKPVPNRFKDYIAIPKANGYQSLHTTLIGMNGVPIEIQIRTQEMEDMANHGIAAHWLYKNEDSSDSSPTHARARRWVKGLLEMQERAGNPVEFIENVKIDLFPDEIYVFTPKGKILEVPKGATAVDFAYAVHTDIGNACVGCLVNRQIAPLSQPLNSGDTIKIITAPGARPNPAWLNFVITAKARSNIRHFLKNLKKQDSIELGRKLLNNSLRNFDTELEALSDASIQSLLQEYQQSKLDELLEDIGLGNRVAYVVARRLLNDCADTSEASTDKAMTVSGTEGMLVTYAKCCRPIPGDPIVGLISKGKGMVIHTEQCRNIVDIRKDPDRCMHLRWDKSMEGEFVVDLRVEMRNSRGVLAGVANAVSQADANIESIEMQDRDATTSRLNLTVSVTSRQHLARVIRRLHGLPAVGSIERVQG